MKIRHNYLSEQFKNSKKIFNLISDTVKFNDFTLGRYVDSFEKEFCKYQNVKYAVGVGSGTDAIFLSLKALGINGGDEIITPTYSFYATAGAIATAGAKPVFVDIKEDLNIDENKIEKKITKKTKVILPVHLTGNPSDMIAIKKIAKKYKLKIIEDSAEALGTFYKKKHAGTFGNAGCLSFNGNKIITTGCGGAVLTNNYKIYNFIKNKINNGKKLNTYELIYEQKTLNFRMPDINAALGISQLNKIKTFIKQKRYLAQKYKELFKFTDRVRFIDEEKDTKSNCWLNSVEIDFKNLKERSLLFIKAKRINLPLRPAWTPLNKLRFLKNCPRSNLNNTNKIYKKIICLPSSAILGK